MGLMDNADNIIRKWINWALPATGSKLEVYQCTLAVGSYTNLVHSGGSAITGKGELVCIVAQNTSVTSNAKLSRIRTTVDGGSAQQTAASLAIWPNGSTTGSTCPPFTIACNLPFNSSLKVEVEGATATTINCYALVRTVI